MIAELPQSWTLDKVNMSVYFKVVHPLKTSRNTKTITLPPGPGCHALIDRRMKSPLLKKILKDHLWSTVSDLKLQHTQVV